MYVYIHMDTYVRVWFAYGGGIHVNFCFWFGFFLRPSSPKEDTTLHLKPIVEAREYVYFRIRMYVSGMHMGVRVCTHMDMYVRVWYAYDVCVCIHMNMYVCINMDMYVRV